MTNSGRETQDENILSQEYRIREHTDMPVTYRIYDTVEGIRSPAPVSDISSLALCSESEARQTLSLLNAIGVVHVENDDSGSPRYWRNEDFFRCQRAIELAGEFETVEGLEEIEQELKHTREALQEMYDVESISDLPLDTENSALREHVREDADQWALIDRTLTDLQIAKVLHNIEDDW